MSNLSGDRCTPSVVVWLGRGPDGEWQITDTNGETYGLAAAHVPEHTAREWAESWYCGIRARVESRHD